MSNCFPICWLVRVNDCFKGVTNAQTSYTYSRNLPNLFLLISTQQISTCNKETVTHSYLAQIIEKRYLDQVPESQSISVWNEYQIIIIIMMFMSRMIVLFTCSGDSWNGYLWPSATGERNTYIRVGKGIIYQAMGKWSGWVKQLK